jgi:ATP-dependent DNA helicase RecG
MPLIRNMPEILPLSVIKKNNLMGYHEAIEKIHFPSSASDIEKAETRLGFNEVFELMLASLLNKQENEHEKSLSIPFRQTLARNFVKNLPFKLTDSQRIVVWRIYQDLQGTQPMNRLVEGDVGSGKTVVAAMAAIMAIKQDFQVAFMAPTEILARQHADTIYRFLQPLGLNDTVGLLVGGMPTVAKTKARKAIATGKMKMIIGTQTLIQESINMDRLGLIIIDEQHRFGVEQRKALMAKAGHMPHVLSLTATPIPRSLALVVYGELDISILSQKPVGRQAFIVCPLITENDFDLSQSAEKVYDRLSHHEFKHRKLGLLHGRMASAQKTKVLEDFLNRKIDILIATTVVEVGIDIPNANCILIESAERFGLAQIHQLRGRVGRAGQQAYCFLVTSDNNPPSRRLTTLETVNDGFRLAEIDLKLRGPGAVYGVAQHGQLDLRFAELSDHKLIAAASESAGEFIKSGENLLKYGVLAEHVGKLRAVTNLN